MAFWPQKVNFFPRFPPCRSEQLCKASPSHASHFPPPTLLALLPPSLAEGAAATSSLEWGKKEDGCLICCIPPFPASKHPPMFPQIPIIGFFPSLLLRTPVCPHPMCPELSGSSKSLFPLNSCNVRVYPGASSQARRAAEPCSGSVYRKKKPSYKPYFFPSHG